MENKEFPNGFDSWMETHHEVVSYITSQLEKGARHCKVNEEHNSGGTGRMYELGEDWTDEFEKLHKDTQWGQDGGLGEYFEEIEQFLTEKNNS